MIAYALFATGFSGLGAATDFIYEKMTTVWWATCTFPTRHNPPQTMSFSRYQKRSYLQRLAQKAKMMMTTHGLAVMPKQCSITTKKRSASYVSILPSITSKLKSQKIKKLLTQRARLRICLMTWRTTKSSRLTKRLAWRMESLLMRCPLATQVLLRLTMLLN